MYVHNRTILISLFEFMPNCPTKAKLFFNTTFLIVPKVHNKFYWFYLGFVIILGGWKIISLTTNIISAEWEPFDETVYNVCLISIWYGIIILIMNSMKKDEKRKEKNQIFVA